MNINPIEDVTVNKYLSATTFNKRNAATDNKIVTHTKFGSHISIHCEKCGDEIGDNDSVYWCRCHIPSGQTVYAYQWRGWHTRDGNARSFTYNCQQILSVCSNCVGTYFKNRNKNQGECLFCNRTVTKEWSAATFRESYRWFCNRLHKNAYYSRRQREKREAKRKDISCQVCNIVFTPKRCNANTCSKKCRQKKYRKMQLSRKVNYL